MNKVKENPAQDLPQALSTVAVVIVVLLVLAGFLRLAFIHWGYTFLIVFVAGAAYYIYSQTKK